MRWITIKLIPNFHDGGLRELHSCPCSVLFFAVVRTVALGCCRWLGSAGLAYHVGSARDRISIVTSSGIEFCPI